ncbi:endonuclease/exonuclease/phosphatase family protein [Aquibium sp. A9E412]|uniref:endonuclease/exonuclease/phosphatase family protein n=1 Tax=Aquibium sp. A9E412 TaxID=2976767 RepID=UPI0025B15DB9|nr:endonuclease/exonuclease/phosphatase family protein [Aquibium sp. A9E412]MDN2567733.1 endonuclease/exonuclease/phosphatase family protein [Aquibium sp. A9E412]
MKIVTYNIQYGIGLDGAYDIARIADAVRGADVIALQEVTRNSPSNEGRDLVAELRALLPDYFAAFGAPFGADMGSRLVDGRAVDTRFEFGNMILSKTPPISVRNHLLPRRRSVDKLNLQRGALEAMIATPFGPVRFYSVHLDHMSADERIAQLAFLMARVNGYAQEGGALTGVVEMGFPEPPHPDSFVLLGDFNMLPDSAEYTALAGRPEGDNGVALRTTLPVDAARRLCGAAAEDGALTTWVDPERPDDASRHKRIDYGFVSADLVARLQGVRVDRAAAGSDHLPLWLELG